MGYIGPRGISLDAWNTWSDYAQAAALGWQAREADACPHGHHLDLWDPQHGGEMLRHVELKARVCPACEHSERMSRAQGQDGDRWPGEYSVWEPVSEVSEDESPAEPAT